MARERYLLDTDESSIHSNIITANTKKEKWNNWWHYNKVKVLVCTLIAAAIISMIYSIVTKVEADYTIAFLYSNYMEDELLDVLEDQLEAYADDRNGDGQVVIEIMNYGTTSNSGDSYDSYFEQAAYVKYVADFTSADSMIWLIDESCWEALGDDIEDLFMIIDDDETSDRLMFTEVQAFVDLDFSLYQGDYYSGTDVEYYFEDLYVCIRECTGTIENSSKLTAYHESSVEFFDNLINGTPIE